jgi:hypothetical protein
VLRRGGSRRHSRWWSGCNRCLIEVGDGAQQQTPMAKRRNANLFEVLIGQIRQDGKIDVIFNKR